MVFIASAIVIVLIVFYVGYNRGRSNIQTKSSKENTSSPSSGPSSIARNHLTIRGSPSSYFLCEDPEDLVKIFVDIGKTTTSDKGGYAMQYSPYFMCNRKKPMDLLEIGLGCYNPKFYSKGQVKPGGSVKVWHLFLPNSTNNFLEYWEQCGKTFPYIYQHLTGQFFWGDQGSPAVLQNIVKTLGKVDVVIDDGGHTLKLQRASLLALFPDLLRPGAGYFVEDLYTGWNAKWGGASDGTGSFLRWTADVQETMMGTTQQRFIAAYPQMKRLSRLWWVTSINRFDASESWFEALMNGNLTLFNSFIPKPSAPPPYSGNSSSPNRQILCEHSASIMASFGSPVATSIAAASQNAQTTHLLPASYALYQTCSRAYISRVLILRKVSSNSAHDLTDCPTWLSHWDSTAVANRYKTLFPYAKLFAAGGRSTSGGLAPCKKSESNFEWIASSLEEDSLKKTLASHPKMDVIIDEGAHCEGDLTHTRMQFLIEHHLTPTGVYYVENPACVNRATGKAGPDHTLKFLNEVGMAMSFSAGMGAKVNDFGQFRPFLFGVSCSYNLCAFHRRKPNE